MGEEVYDPTIEGICPPLWDGLIPMEGNKPRFEGHPELLRGEIFLRYGNVGAQYTDIKSLKRWQLREEDHYDVYYPKQ